MSSEGANSTNLFSLGIVIAIVYPEMLEGVKGCGVGGGGVYPICSVESTANIFILSPYDGG